MTETQTVLNERYALREQIGSGGMAAVYAADDLRLGRRVAVKVLAPSEAEKPGAVERFRREAQAAAALSHPNVVAVYDWGTVDDTAFLVMEFVDGPDLRRLLRSQGRLTEAEAVRLAADVAAALESAHHAGIVHRDVKPRNVLLDPHGSAKLADFGIASGADDRFETEAGVVYGTALYVSPEQALGQTVDGRSDLYSLGVLLYEALTGEPPFRGASAAEVAEKHVHRQAIPPRRLRPELSHRTEQIVLRALAKDPAQRFADAAQMRSALLAAAAALGEASPGSRDGSRDGSRHSDDGSRDGSSVKLSVNSSRDGSRDASSVNSLGGARAAAVEAEAVAAQATEVEAAAAGAAEAAEPTAEATGAKATAEGAQAANAAVDRLATSAASPLFQPAPRRSSKSPAAARSSAPAAAPHAAGSRHLRGTPAAAEPTAAADPLPSETPSRWATSPIPQEPQHSTTSPISHAPARSAAAPAPATSRSTLASIAARLAARVVAWRAALARRTQNRGLGSALVAGAVPVLLLAAIAVRADVLPNPLGSAPAPAVAGMPVDAAREAATRAGFNLDVEEQTTTETPAGIVVSQEQRGSSLRVLVSRGLSVPDIGGRQCAQARAELASTGWRVRPVRWRFANIEDFGKIVAQEPAAGAVVARPGEITVQVAGPVAPC